MSSPLTVPKLKEILVETGLVKGELFCETSSKKVFNISIGCVPTETTQGMMPYKVASVIKLSSDDETDPLQGEIVNLILLGIHVQPHNAASAIAQHKLKLESFLNMGERTLTSEQFQRYVELTGGGQFLPQNFWDDWGINSYKYLNSKGVNSRNWKQLFYNVTHLDFKPVAEIADLTIAGVPTETIQTFQDLPTQWIKQAAGETETLLLDDTDQPIFMRLNQKHKNLIKT